MPTQLKTSRPQRSFFALLFGLFFCALGGFFLWLSIQSFVQTALTYRWEPVPAEIHSLEIDFPQKAPDGRKKNVFALKVQYEYTYAGKKHQGTSLRCQPLRADSYEKLANLRWQLIRDETDQAFVNPNDPTTAILQHDSLWCGLFILFPIPFVVIGLLVMAAGAGFLPTNENSKRKKSSRKRRGKSPARERIAMALFGFAFSAAGLGGMFPLLINPVMRHRASQDWTKVPCTVIWSRVQIHSGDDGNTYSPDVFYKYEFENSLHYSNRYWLASGSSSGLRSKREIIRKYPAGKATHCFVNPERPHQAVLNRNLSVIGFWWLIPSIFLVIGVCILLSMFKRNLKENEFFNQSSEQKKRTGKHQSSSANALTHNENAAETSSRKLRPDSSRLGKLLLVVFIAVIWTGIVSALFGPVWMNLLRRGPGIDVFLLLFSIPFILANAVLVIAVLQALATLLSPRVILQLTPGSPRTGMEVVLSWEVRGGWTRIQQLAILMEGRETTSYQRGTTTTTDEETFFRRVLVEESDPIAIAGGRVIYEIPLGVMPSLELKNDSISWRITVLGRIAWWPNLDTSYEIKLLPFART